MYCKSIVTLPALKTSICWGLVFFGLEALYDHTPQPEVYCGTALQFLLHPKSLLQV